MLCKFISSKKPLIMPNFINFNIFTSLETRSLSLRTSKIAPSLTLRVGSQALYNTIEDFCVLRKTLEIFQSVFVWLGT